MNRPGLKGTTEEYSYILIFDTYILDTVARVLGVQQNSKPRSPTSHQSTMEEDDTGMARSLQTQALGIGV